MNLAPVETTKSDEDVAMQPTDTDAASHVAGNMMPSSDQIPQLLRRLTLLSNASSEKLLGTRKATLPCFALPQLHNRDFIHRPDVFAAIDKHLLAEPYQTRTSVEPALFALCGMGGIGKTSIAIEYALARQSKFSAVFWLEAAGFSQLASDFGRISTQLGLEEVDSATNLETSIEIAKAWFTKTQPDSEGGKKTWLLIFDNADNLDLITSYLPTAGDGSILVTSRDPFAKEQFFVMNSSGLDVDFFTTNESVTLLDSLLLRDGKDQSKDEKGASEELAHNFGGLPLALTQMAGIIRRRHLSVRDFVDLYTNDARYAEVNDVTNAVQARNYRYTLATMYSFEDLSAKAKRLLDLMAFLSPDRIREDIFVNKNPILDAATKTYSAAEFEEARYELLNSSLIRRNIPKKELWVHRIVQANTRLQLTEVERFQVFQDAVDLLMRVWPKYDPVSPITGRWPLCEDLLPHLERFNQLYVEYQSVWSTMSISTQFPVLLNEAAAYEIRFAFFNCKLTE